MAAKMKPGFPSKKVAIIGAGLAGLAATKACLEEGLMPFCFETDSDIGGLWNCNNTKCIPRSTLTNVSKEMSAFSDFPFPKECPNFIHRDEQMKYFYQYAKKFDLLKYIHLKHEVKKMDPVPNDENKVIGWWLDYSLPSGAIEKKVFFDAVIVATGFNRWPFVTKELEDSLEGFSGDICHSSDYDSFDKYVGKRVVICGIGNSGGDIGCELSYHAEQVFLCTNVGTIVVRRYGIGGKVFDVENRNRITENLPFCIKMFLLKTIADLHVNGKVLGLELEDGKFSITMNDEIPVRIGTGKLRICAGIEKCQGNTLILKDGRVLKDIDAIVLCTGFKMKFPFLPEEYVPVLKSGKYMELYKYMFPVKFAPLLSFVGMVRLDGSTFPICEMQARYIASVLSGRVTLPTKPEMEKDIARRYTDNTKYSERNSFMQVDWVGEHDDLAATLGAKPNIFKTLITDPALGMRLIFGPPISAQYRLIGPHSWTEARDTIMGVQERVWYPIIGRRHLPKGRSIVRKLFLIGIILAVILWLYNAV